MLTRNGIEGFGVRALDGVDAEMDGVIVAVAHDEFLEMGFRYKRL